MREGEAAAGAHPSIAPGWSKGRAHRRISARPDCVGLAHHQHSARTEHSGRRAAAAARESLHSQTPVGTDSVERGDLQRSRAGSACNFRWPAYSEFWNRTPGRGSPRRGVTKIATRCCPSSGQCPPDLDRQSDRGVTQNGAARVTDSPAAARRCTPGPRSRTRPPHRRPARLALTPRGRAAFRPARAGSPHPPSTRGAGCEWVPARLRRRPRDRAR